MSRSVRTVLAGALLLFAVLPATPASGYNMLAPVILISTSTVPAGGSLTVTGANFTDNGKVDFWLHSTVIVLGSTTASAKGRFSVRLTIPSDVAPGQHVLQALDEPTGDLASAALTVTGPGVQPPPIAGTGVAIAKLGGLALALIAFGQALIMAGRRRRTRA